MIAFIGIGIPVLAIDLFFLIISLANRDKWKTPKLKGGQEEAIEILDKRYAKGEISRQEYKQIKEDIKGFGKSTE